MSDYDLERRKFLMDLIKSEVFTKNQDEQIEYFSDPNIWIFDFRKILMAGLVSDCVSEIFYDEFKYEYPFQIGAQEIAGVPLMTSLVNKFYQKGHLDSNGFFIRKSRKKTGLLHMVEGKIQKDKKIILVDDTMNLGGTFWRQVEVLDSLGYCVDTVWSILQYRDTEFYERFLRRGIKVKSLFSLNDFTSDLGPSVRNLISVPAKPVAMPFSCQWVFSSDHPSHVWVVGKSQPALDNQKIYFGADNEVFWALNQSDGSVAWKFKVGLGDRKKSIFSSPILHDNLVIFGSYDGNVYALDKETGKEVWICYEADWVGSSPAISKKLGLVFIGMEFGLIYKRGGIAAIDVRTGEVVWRDYTHPALTHCSPYYIEEHSQVVIGSNDGTVRLYDAKDGTLLWKFTTFGGAEYRKERDHGFGAGDIKDSFAYDHKRDYIIFGSIDGFLYVLQRSTGYLVYSFKCNGGIWSTPLVYNNRVYFTSLDKHLRAIDLDTLTVQFEKNLDSTRIFSTPSIINGHLYVGTNAARLHEIDPATGSQLGYFQAVERITNTLVYNSETDTYFLPTYANQILCLKRQ